MTSASPATDRTRIAMCRAAAVIPTGSTSAARLGVRPHPLAIAAADGCRLTDVDGRSLIDFQLANGPMLLGHRPPAVIEAVDEQLRRGVMYGAQHALEADVAEALVDAVPSAEQVLFNTTGSEAVHTALRLARAATGRSLVVRFEGHYHGWLSDIAFGGPGAPASPADVDAPLAAAPLTGGMAAAQDLVVARWNDHAGLERLMARFGPEVAAIVCEPVPLNGLLEPRDGFLDLLRRATTASGALLVFDEVVTGFRVGLGGAQARYGVTPDLTVLAKALGAGFPVSAVAGAAAVMAAAADGRMAHMGTFNGHPPSLAAAGAALDAYRRPGFHREVTARAEQLAVGLRLQARDLGVPLRVHQVGGMLQTLFLPEDADPRCAGDLVDQDRTRAAAFSEQLLARGVFVPPRNTWMLSSAHSSSDVDEALAASDSALRVLAKGAA